MTLWLATTPSVDDERAILAIRAGHDVAYNDHDARALAALYASDGSVYVKRKGVWQLVAERATRIAEH